jgi:hypothetical protein
MAASRRRNWVPWTATIAGGSTFRTDAKKALLSQFRFRVNERFLYEYDFGDARNSPIHD